MPVAVHAAVAPFRRLTTSVLPLYACRLVVEMMANMWCVVMPQLAGMGINPRDMDNIVDALRLHILPEVRFDDESGLGKAPSGG